MSKKQNFQLVAPLGKLSVVVLTKDIAKQFQQELFQLLRLIPQVPYKPRDVLRQSRPGRIFLGKWEHSLAVFDQRKPVALIFAYEREAEQNDQYPEPCLYVSEVAVDPAYQGKKIGRRLLKLFLKFNQEVGFRYVDGEWNVKLQTNASKENAAVRKFYQLNGFTAVGEKKYENRTDIILKFPKNRTSPRKSQPKR